ncbi:MAG: DUF2752 domain-containing protein [Bacteroidales bacterium]|nr:DUF2752 domain-containing protein [Bacteroidales bacterium]
MTQWLEEHQLPCIFHRLFGIECPTCGFQRSFIYLLKGEFRESLTTYPALVPTLIMLMLLVMWLFFRKPGLRIIRPFAVADLVLIFGSYFFRLLTG